MASPEAIQNRITELQQNIHCLEFDHKQVQVDAETWLQTGQRKITIADETEYCDGALLRDILSLKSSLDNQDERKVKWARSKGNFFEVRSGQFMNRAAIKIANLDAMFDWRLCQLPDASQQQKDNLLYFVDVFGGPGGCSEYVLWRNGWNAKGFGFSTKGDYEFRPEMFRAGAPESLDPFYGPNDCGNIFDPDNIRGFIEYVLAQTEDLGAHLIMCDGGFYVKNNGQEIISKQLYLCLVLLAVNVIRPGGNAILKVFDLYTPFSVGLVYILSKSYGKVSIVKPASSRPANSERYLICQNRLNREKVFGEYLVSINQVLWENKHCDHDILHIVSKEMIEQDANFYNFIRNSNNDLARRQINGLKILIGTISNKFNQEPVDPQLVQSTLWRLWKLDHKSCVSPSADDKTKLAADYALQFLEKETLSLFNTSDALLTGKKALRKIFGDPHEWNFLPIDVTLDQGKIIRTMFVSKGNGNVFYYKRAEADWRQVKEYQLMLSPRTILYGEIVEEISEKNNKQKIVIALHIIDAIMLGGENIRCFPLAKRNALCAKFAKAMNRPLADRSDSEVRPIPVRCKQLLSMTDLDSFFNNVSINQLTDGTKVLGIDMDRFDAFELKRFFIPRGLLFLRHLQPGCALGTKGAEKPLDFSKTFASRHMWTWTKTNQIYSSAQCFDVVKEPNLVYRQDFDQFISEFMQE